MLWLNLSAFVVTAIATGYLFFIVSKTAKELKKGFLFLALGILISVSIHSFGEFLESFGIINTESLLLLMPLMVLIGSILILIGSVVIFNVITQIQGGGGRSLKNEKK